MTRYTELTGCRVTVQQAPMGAVSTSALAVAVADAGGVGSINAMLAGLAARTAGVLAANFLTGHRPGSRGRGGGPGTGVDFFWTDPDGAGRGRPLCRAPRRAATSGTRELRPLLEWCSATRWPVRARAAAGVSAASCRPLPRVAGARPRRGPGCCGPVSARAGLDGETVGQTTSSGRKITLPKGHGTPPGTAATGHIGAMPMYAGESAASVTAVEPAARIVDPGPRPPNVPGKAETSSVIVPSVKRSQGLRAFIGHLPG